MRTRLLTVGAAVCVLGWLTPVVLPAHAATTVSVPQANRISGVDLQTYHDTTMNPDFAKIAADGANMVNITVWWEVPASSSNSIVPVYGSVTISDSQLIGLAQQAESAGLQVAITPDFVVGSSGGWRGGYNPPDPAAFFSNYTQMLDHYAAIAQQLKMPMFWVGSEMNASEQYPQQWASAISSVRQRYSGQVLYDVNWTDLPHMQFYGLLDAVSISAYYPLSNDADPSLAQLLSAWHGANPSNSDWFSQVLSAEQVWGKPIYFGEAGYSFSTYAAGKPYSETYVSSDPDLQYRCYQALDETFRGQPWWGGVLWWAWDGGVYNMDGEPAESLVGTNSVSYPPPSVGRASPAPAGPTAVRPTAVTAPVYSHAPVPANTGSPPLGTTGPTAAGAATGGAFTASPLPVKARAGAGSRTHTGSRAGLVSAGIALVLLVLVALAVGSGDWFRRLSSRRRHRATAR